ncbi:MAG: hypothetical protein AAFY36_00535 [Bacteroidota bacterium]
MQRLKVILSVGLLLMVFSLPTLKGQSISEEYIPGFYITISTEANEVSFTCNEGCAWTELSYTSEDISGKGVITEQGFVAFESEIEASDEVAPGFGFSVRRDEEYIRLYSFVGTAWTELSFTLQDGEEQAFDQDGMRE